VPFEDLIHDQLDLIKTLLNVELVIFLFGMHDTAHHEGILLLIAASDSDSLSAYATSFMNLGVEFLNVNRILGMRLEFRCHKLPRQFDALLVEIC